MKTFLETWRDIEGYEGLYQVSDFGDVRRLAGNGCKKTRVLKPAKYGCGYLYVNFCKNNKVKKHKIHRLVATAFIPNLYNLPEVNHIDEDKTNNRVDNLEWCTSKQNCNHGTRNERIADALRGMKCPYVTEAKSKKVLQLTLDGKIVREWSSTKECGRNGFDQGAVSKCCNGKRKMHKGYRWMYAEDYYKLFA